MTAPFDGPGSRWFTIPAHRPFVDDLAAVLYRHLSADGAEGLTDAIVLTPTRRGARALAEGFVKAAAGQPVLLPQIRAVGDLDEGEPPFEPGAIALGLPPAVSPLRRRFELARLIVENKDAIGSELDAPAALEMADALAAFMDSLWIEEKFHEASLADLGGDHAQHWAQSARILAIALEQWPRRLESLGLIDPTDRQVRLSKRLAEQWRERPPPVPLIAAGSTGTAPATADLLAAVAGAPRGCVVLPGLDKNLADTAWAAIEREPQHPQFGMKRLLARNRLDRDAVDTWPALDETTADELRGLARRRVINEALRPAEATADWLRVIATLNTEKAETGVDPFDLGLRGLSVVSARTEEEVATAAALLMREALEDPDKTCALVTPDQVLARRVSARLARWGLEADSSAGAPLAGFAVGTLIGLLAELAGDPAAPVPLLAALKSPLVRLGDEADGLAAFEKHALRGPRLDGWPSLQARLDGKRGPDRDGRPAGEDLLAEVDAAEAFAARVLGALQPLIAAFADGPSPLGAATRALTETLERLAADTDSATGALWAGAPGQSASRLLAGLMEDAEALPPVDAAAFHEVIVKLLAEETVRPGGATHPRLKILGAIEARLVRADRLVLAGLEEGAWPQGAQIDPFLSRPMRERLGLPSPERKTGLSAHDFAQAACAPEVFLLHSERRGGQPAVQSRWLWRLATLAHGAGRELPRRTDVLDWARALDAAETDPPASLRPAVQPAPTPPLEARPKTLPVTQIEAWVRDPYAVYARNVLRLYPMERPDEPVDARIRGSAIHTAMEDFAQAWPTLPLADQPAAFAGYYITALRKFGAPPPTLTREQPLAMNAGRWIAGFEAERRASPVEVLVERKVSLKLEGLDFTLTARADRIEIARGPDSRGLAHVIDFKTGAAPSKKSVKAGFNGQLPLTAAMLARGGLPGVSDVEPGELLYVTVTGRNPAGKLESRGLPGQPDNDFPASEELVAQAWAGLHRLVARFQHVTTPYRSRVAPQFIKHKSDYDQLARVHEWAVSDEDAGDGSGGGEAAS